MMTIEKPVLVDPAVPMLAAVDEEPRTDVDIVEYPSEPTPEEVDWADGYLSHLPTLVSFAAYKRVRVWQTPDGRWWRQAGAVTVSPYRTGRFRIHLYTGAQEADLEYFETIVERAKEGRLVRWGWKEFHRDGEKYWQHKTGRLVAHGCQLIEDSPLLVACTLSSCREQYHEVTVRDGAPDYDDLQCVRHIADTIETDDYKVEVSVWADELDEGWKVALMAEDLYSMTLTQTAGLINDLQWMHATAKRLNAAQTGQPISEGAAS